ncbi:hypothetical protein AMC83_PA00059 (plasmid) [Rhizobium phaseoli]|uniref:hypothetical protein n=1 Tax=Rhizobium phaseoli TaxID=396 RepID=UPI0007F11E2E|nr:hypothetical protein [Rhizobium phaseoli]ANL74286.1 hypothetical protein AMC83_PA00059 [Rhizobium phaseoli]
MSRYTAFVIMTLLSACATDVYADNFTTTELNPQLTDFVKAAVAKRLKDPESAKFPEAFSASKNTADPTDITVCGKVNGRNSFGAYAGSTPFYVKLTKPWPMTKDPAYALVTMIGGEEFDPEVVIEMCKGEGVSHF